MGLALLTLPFAKAFEPRLNSRAVARAVANHRRHDAQRSPAQQIANPTALAHISAATFSQNFFTD